MGETRVHGLTTHLSVLIGVSDPTNHQAWELFITRYGPMIRGWCRHWFPRAADGMAHEVFTKLLFVMRTYHYQPEKGRFRGWLKTVTHRLMAELKRDARSPGFEFPALEDLAAPQDLEARLAAEYDLELLEQAKENVRVRVEAQTWLAYQETAELGRKPCEVARELGMKVGTVYQAKHSVLAALKREIETLEGSESGEAHS